MVGKRTRTFAEPAVATAPPLRRTPKLQPDASFQLAAALRRPRSVEQALQLQRTLGNRATGRLLRGAAQKPTARSAGAPLPTSLRHGLEDFAGFSLENVRVYRRSSEPARIGALAFTRGGEIHLGPGQERHLPHEGWHAVQQAQGRVRPTGRAVGVDLNDEPRLEREADRMGAMARNRPARPEADRRARPTVEASAPSPAQPVLQRRVGFEFEMNWTVKAPGNTIGAGTEIITGTNWHAEPDMRPVPDPNERHYTGFGNLEFVTAAFEEDAGGRFDLQFAVNQIVNLVNVIAARWYGLGGWGEARLADFVNGGVAWGANTPAARRDDIWIDRRRSAGVASPQMTAGIRLENVSSVLDEMGQTTPAGQPDLYGRAPSPAGQALHAARARIHAVHGRAVQQANLAAGMTAAERQRYEGALAHLGLIVALGAVVDVGTNEKYLTPFLSRTNFGDLPYSIRTSPTLIRDVVIASGRGNNANWLAVSGNPLFASSPNMNQRTIANWLTDIANGNDPLQWGQEGDLTRFDPQAVGPQGHRSIGHVYEFRGVSRRLPVAGWLAWALGLFDRVRDVLNQ